MDLQRSAERAGHQLDRVGAAGRHRKGGLQECCDLSQAPDGVRRSDKPRAGSGGSRQEPNWHCRWWDRRQFWHWPLPGSTGADEILVFADMPNSISCYGAQKSGSRQIFANLKLLDLCPVCYANFQLFEESRDKVDAQWEERRTDFLLSPDTSTLHCVSIGTLKLTTAENKYFGISGGRSVKVHVISCVSGLGIGGKAYEDCATLVNDIVAAMLRRDSRVKVQAILKWLQ